MGSRTLWLQSAGITKPVTAASCSHSQSDEQWLRETSKSCGLQPDLLVDQGLAVGVEVLLDLGLSHGWVVV